MVLSSYFIDEFNIVLDIANYLLLNCLKYKWTESKDDHDNWYQNLK